MDAILNNIFRGRHASIAIDFNVHNFNYINIATYWILMLLLLISCQGVHFLKIKDILWLALTSKEVTPIPTFKMEVLKINY